MRKLIVIVLLAAAFVTFIFSLRYCRSKNDSSALLTESRNACIGDSGCRTCHKKEYDDWRSSDHFKSLMPANDSSVLGDFNNASFTADGVRWTMTSTKGRYYISSEESKTKKNTYEVLYTFGHFPLQQYLVAFPGGRLQATRLSWDSRSKKWFQQYPGKKIDPADWLHWTKGGQNWNTMCAACHSTDFNKNYVPSADSFHSTWSVSNVSCESCHGPGQAHIAFINSANYRGGERVAGSFLNLGKKGTQTQIINTCAPCHAVKSDISAQPMSSGELMDNYIPDMPADERYHPDGQVKDESYTYTSFLQSKMYRYGVTCNNCHNPHSGRLLFTANQLCLQCHNKSYDAPSHHFHKVNTTAAECRSCHMPSGTFMGNDIRHDHSLRAPRPDLSVTYGTPNACNNCHNNKSSQWSADAVAKWYGPVRRYHFADDLLPGSKMDQNSVTRLRKLLSDTAVAAMPKTAALFYLGNILSPAASSTIIAALKSTEAQIRYQALKSLANFPPDEWLSSAAPLLSDKVRAVRIAAADLFLTVPADRLPETYRKAGEYAKAELDHYLLYQRDFPSGNVMLGDHYFRLNDYANAISYYNVGLKMDSLMNYARLNLSAAYNAIGANEQALNTLHKAAKIDGNNDRIFYNLGLLYSEMNKTAEAIQSFERASNLNSDNPRLYYNYGLMLLQVNQTRNAENILLKGLRKAPGEPDLNYALTFLYVKTGDLVKAKKYAQTLKTMAPGNAKYQALIDQVLNGR